jgi:uncharacterized integral membrane protein
VIVISPRSAGFVVSNSTRVEVSFVIFSGRAPLILIMLLCVVIGLLLGVVAVGLIAFALYSLSDARYRRI